MRTVWTEKRKAGSIWINKFGENLAIGAPSEDLWSPGGLIPYLTAADNVRVRAGGNPADTDGGAGAETIRIVGLDENWEHVEEIVALAGVAQSAQTSATFIRVFRVFVETVGTYGGSNVANIDIEDTAGTLLAEIVAAEGQTEMCAYTVPRGHVGYVYRVTFNPDAARATNAFMYARENADLLPPDCGAWQKKLSLLELEFTTSKEFTEPLRFPEKTDIRLSAIATSGSRGMSASFDIEIVPL